MPEAKDAFDKARDWRAHQITLLNPNERAAYDRIRADGAKREQEQEKKRERTLSQRIEEETRQNLLARRNLVLEMFTSENARRRNAEREAERAVQIADEHARKQEALQTLEQGDAYLRARETQRQFQRAAARLQQNARTGNPSLRREFNERTRVRSRDRDGGRDGRS